MLQPTAKMINALLSKTLGVRVVRKAFFSDEWSRKKAWSAIAAIEKFNGQKLTPKLRRTANEYAREILGRVKYAPWLYVYSLVSGTFKEGWIPDNYFWNVVLPKIDKGLGSVTAIKSFTNIVLDTDYLPDLAYYIDGVFYDRAYNVVDIEVFRKAVCAYPEVFLKKDGSIRGLGIVRVGTSELTAQMFRAVGNCAIQRPIAQHRFFDDIISGSVATLRITTVKEPTGSIKTRAAYLRVGRSDTAWVQSDNSVRIAITDRDGRLDDVGYTQTWQRCTAHPDTSFAFRGHRVPEFKGAVSACEELHRTVPQVTIVGWDVAINALGKVELLEWNGDRCDIVFSEATTGPCFLGLNW